MDGWKYKTDRPEEGWKGAYMMWLRRCASIYLKAGKCGVDTLTKPPVHSGLGLPPYNYLCKIMLLGDGFVTAHSLINLR